MSGLAFFDSFRRSLRRRKLEQRLGLARTWPVATGEVNLWKVQQAEDDTGSFSSSYQIEAAFHFILKGEYYGGYFRSVPMSHHEAETLGQGNPAVHIRYNPTNPDDHLVVAEDNADLPFKVASI
jgi:hypothetical protein